MTCLIKKKIGTKDSTKTSRLMKIKDTKTNKIFILILILFIMLLTLSTKCSNRKKIEIPINYENDISISAISADINIWVDNTLDEGKVVYNASDNSNLEVKEDNNGKTIIKETRKRKLINFVFNGDLNPTISLYLPSSDLNNLNIKTISGNIDFYDYFSFEDLKISSTSGNINLLDIDSRNNIIFETTSSDISLGKVNSKNFEISSTSGENEITSINSENISISNVSGDSYIDEINTNTLSISATSSDIEFSNIQVNNEINISNISGDIDLVLPKKEYKYDINTLSGDITVDDIEYVKKYSTQNGIPINIETISGEINITTTE